MARVIRLSDLMSPGKLLEKFGSMVKPPEGPPGIEKCESPIEEKFYRAAYEPLSRVGKVFVQYHTGPYRLDFAVKQNYGAPALFAIEIEGHDYHSTKEQLAHDTKRERFLLARGIIIIRFTGSQVFEDPEGCAQEACGVIRSWFGA